MSTWTDEDSAAFATLVDHLSLKGDLRPDATARLLCAIWGGPRAALAEERRGSE